MKEEKVKEKKLTNEQKLYKSMLLELSQGEKIDQEILDLFLEIQNKKKNK